MDETMRVFCYVGINVPALGLVRAENMDAAEIILKNRYDGEEFYIDEVLDEKYEEDGVQPLVF